MHSWRYHPTTSSSYFQCSKHILVLKHICYYFSNELHPHGLSIFLDYMGFIINTFYIQQSISHQLSIGDVLNFHASSIWPLSHSSFIWRHHSKYFKYMMGFEDISQDTCQSSYAPTHPNGFSKANKLNMCSIFWTCLLSMKRNT